MTWEILSAQNTTGVYYTGPHSKPVTGNIDQLVVKPSTKDDHGSLLFHLPPDSKYVFVSEEVADLVSVIGIIPSRDRFQYYI